MHLGFGLWDDMGWGDGVYQLWGGIFWYFSKGQDRTVTNIFLTNYIMMGPPAV